MSTHDILPVVSLRTEATESPARPLRLSVRLLLFLLLFGAEWIPISTLVHKELGGHSFFQWPVLCASMFLAFLYLRDRAAWQSLDQKLAFLPIRWGYFAGHAAAFFGFIGLSLVPLPGNSEGVELYRMAWYAAGALTVSLAGFSLFPPRWVWQLVRCAGATGFFALVAGTLTWRLLRVPYWVGDRIWNGNAWLPISDLTFQVVKALLHLFYSEVVADQVNRNIGTTKFSVSITGACSGWEGTALILVFSVSCLCLFWREFRFPRALLLIPAAATLIWLCNALRITAMILIGNAGAPDIAMGGFHSQAGWIAFNAVALGLAVAVPRMSWFTVQQEKPISRPATENPTAAYLTPFLAILAAGLISRAAAGEFEWLYPLRFFAAGTAIWLFRSKYTQLNWKFGWPAVATGAATFGMWLGLDWFTGASADKGIPAGLALLPAAARIGWIVVRASAATLTVPVAEELAFRGFAIRRLISNDFESVNPSRWTYWSIAVSSLAFGLLHGNRWLAGTLAGVLYAAVYVRRGRIGDAVAAHAITNALLAVWVLSTGNWSLW